LWIGSSDDPAALSAIRDSWATLDDAGRSALLAQPSIAIGNVTFSNDGVTDRLYGGPGSDWFAGAGDQIVP
jgi:hypothetical protein